MLLTRLALLSASVSLSLAAVVPKDTQRDVVRLGGDDDDPAQGARYRPLPPLREQDALERQWVKKRWDHVPSILKKHGYDAWLLSMREYAEDTAFRALVPTTTVFSARRRSVFLFHTHPTIESPLYLIDNTEGIWDTLNAALSEIDPQKIAIDVDAHVAFADGLHAGETHALMLGLDPEYLFRTSPCRAIPVEVIAARVGGEAQLEQYQHMMETVWAMVSDGFSEKVITAGVTTPQDLEWWFRDTMRWRLGTGTWFPPSVDISRHPDEPSVEDHPQFRPGDMIHVDIGITAMGMNTDTQHLGYILRHNETAPPAGLVEGMRNANKLQDFVREEMVPGRTGNEVLFAVFDRMNASGLDGDIYSHPIGDYGHSAGAVIGFTNIQGFVPHLGENKVLEDYWTSVELAGRTYVPEWGRVVRVSHKLSRPAFTDPWHSLSSKRTCSGATTRRALSGCLASKGSSTSCVPLTMRASLLAAWVRTSVHAPSVGSPPSLGGRWPLGGKGIGY